MSFLAEHPADKVTLIVGNHDLTRIGELWEISDERFALATARASVLYAEPPDERAEAAFLREFPEFPSVEAAARDFSAFRVEQRELVLGLLESRRLRLAAAFGDLLFCHAGVTRDDLVQLGVQDANSEEVAQALNGALDDAFERWDRTRPFDIPGLHMPGSADRGEGGGILFHRAASPLDRPGQYAGPQRRRYDPRRIPRGITQVVGHVRDPKSRSLLGEWVRDAAPPREGRIRGLVTDGGFVDYRLGFPETGAELGSIVFVDGGMHYVDPADYELLDVRGRGPLPRTKG